jgi:hypothetical protein
MGPPRKATRAVAVSRPTPGMVISSATTGVCLAMASICFVGS